MNHALCGILCSRGQDMEALSIDNGSFASTARKEIILWQKNSVTPRLHLLEDRLVPCIHHIRVALRLHGEQDCEAIHHRLKEMEKRLSKITHLTSCAE